MLLRKANKIWDFANRLCEIPLFVIGMLLVTMFSCMYFLCGCETQNKGETISSEAKDAQRITYTLDSRTGLCYVVSYVSEYPIGTATIYTHVPCSPEVMKLVK